MLRIEDLTVRFGGVVALDTLTVEIDDDVVGVIGPNGAGKTTLINALSGFLTPSAGCVFLDDADLLTMKPHQRARSGLARTFQSIAAIKDLSLADSVRVALDSHTMAGKEASAALHRALDHVGLVEQGGVPGARANTFQARMIEIARSLVTNPRLVLLDEPGGGLSAAEKARLRQVIAGIKATFGAQVLLIEHDVDLIRATCSRTLVLDFGKLIANGPTLDVLQDARVKAAYLGTTAVS